MNYKRDEKWIGARIHCGARVLSNNTTNRQFISSQMRESRGRTVENRMKSRWCPIIKLRSSKKSREFSKHVRAIIGDCADSFYALLLPRFAKHKIQPERQIPQDFRRRAGEEGEDVEKKTAIGRGWKQPTWKSQFLLFSTRPFLPSSSRAILAMALSIDYFDRSAEIYRPQERPLVRRIVLPCHNAKSRFSLPATRDGGNHRASCLWRCKYAGNDSVSSQWLSADASVVSDDVSACRV